MIYHCVIILDAPYFDEMTDTDESSTGMTESSSCESSENEVSVKS